MISGRRWEILICLIGTASGYAQTARAQGASTTVRASVLQAIVITPSRNLTFGNVFPGVSKTIPATSGGAHGRFDVTGQANASISLTFTLPTHLVSGANLLPVGSWTGRHNINPVAGPGTSFTPSGTTTNTTLSGAGFRYVFIGATVSPAADQAAGLYSAQASLTVTYF